MNPSWKHKIINAVKKVLRYKEGPALLPHHTMQSRKVHEIVVEQQLLRPPDENHVKYIAAQSLARFIVDSDMAISFVEANPFDRMGSYTFKTVFYYVEPLDGVDKLYGNTFNQSQQTL